MCVCVFECCTRPRSFPCNAVPQDHMNNEAPDDLSELEHYLIFLAEDGSGANRSYLGTIPNGSYLLTVPAETALLSFTHIVIYAKSSLVEQTTPAALTIVDTVSSVSGIVFVDQDLDLLELGGMVSWVPPRNVDQVQLYNVYLSQNQVGRNLDQFNVSNIGTNEALLRFE